MTTAGLQLGGNLIDRTLTDKIANFFNACSYFPAPFCRNSAALGRSAAADYCNSCCPFANLRERKNCSDRPFVTLDAGGGFAGGRFFGELGAFDGV